MIVPSIVCWMLSDEYRLDWWVSTADEVALAFFVEKKLRSESAVLPILDSSLVFLHTLHRYLVLPFFTGKPLYKFLISQSVFIKVSLLFYLFLVHVD